MVQYRKSLPWQWDLPRGIVSNVGPVRGVGEIPAPSSGVEQDIWDRGSTYSYLSSAVPIYMQAASTAVIGGSFTIIGLNSSWDVTTATGSLSTANGQTQTVVVSTATNWLRIFSVLNQSSVASTSNVYVTTQTTVVSTSDGSPPLANTLAMIRSGRLKTQMAQYTVPRDHYGQITKLRATVAQTSGSTTGDKSALIRMQVREQGKGFVNMESLNCSLSGGTVGLDYDQWESIPARSDIRFRCVPRQADSFVNVGFSLFNIGTSSTGA